jgi:hypothetical protein
VPRIVVAFATVMLGIGSAAMAQPASQASAPRLELWAGVSGTPSGASGQLVSSYSPALLFDGEFTSHGAQTLVFRHTSAAGFEGGGNWFVTPYAGVQILVDRVSADVSGANGPYDVSLHYISRPPPSNQPIPVDVARSSIWPETAGSLTQLTMALNGVVRIGQPARVSATLSGGLSYYRLNGAVQPLGYTTYRLGGHSVLFEDDYRLALSLDPASALGYNLGGDLSLTVHRGVAVMVGYRYFGGPTVDVPARVTTILNADQVIVQQPIADINARLAPGPARVDLSGSRLVVGLKLRR